MNLDRWLRDGENLKFGVALLLVVGIVLGVRSEAAIRAVLSFKGATSVTADSQVARTKELSEKMESRDRLLDGAVVGPRDPFHAPPAPQQAVKQVRAPKPVPPVQPVIRAFLYDNVNPSVQIGVGAEVSGWMRKGDSFQGWTVVEITNTTVRVSRSGTSLVLATSFGGDS